MGHFDVGSIETPPTSTFENVCVPPDYKPIMFCGELVTDTEACRLFQNQFTQCTEPVYDADLGLFTPRKRTNATEWESHSTDDVQYKCDDVPTINGKCGDYLTWSLKPDIGKLTITGTGEMWNFDSSENSAPWRNERSSIVTVEIGSEVTSIGDWAFVDCAKLSGVVIPDKVLSIGNGAFKNCTQLTSLDLGNVTFIGQDAFEHCLSLTNVAIPASVTSISYGAFAGCPELTSITVEEGSDSFKSFEGVLLY